MTLSFRTLFCAFIVALSGFLFGYHIGVISGTLPLFDRQFHLSALQQGFLVSVILIGGVIGALSGGWLADRFGRKKTLLMTIALFLIATACLIDSEHYAMALLGRLIVGVAVGIGSVVAPLYIAELSPVTYRGALVSLNQLMIALGILFAFWSSYLYADSPHWRHQFLLGLIPTLIQLVGLIWVPEPFSGECEKERGSFRELLRPSIQKALFVGIGISILQQVSGINTVIYYAPHIFQTAGYVSVESAMYATTWVGGVNVCMTLVGLVLIDRWGRKTLLNISLFGMTLSLGGLGSALMMSGSHQGEIAMISLFIYIASFAVGLGIVPWILLSEIYPSAVRGRAMGCALFANWVFNYLVALTFLPLVHAVGMGLADWLFALICLFGIFFAKKYIPETKGKTFAEIQQFWHKNS